LEYHHYVVLIVMCCAEERRRPGTTNFICYKRTRMAGRNDAAIAAALQAMAQAVGQ
jgi:hypothetical protein